MPNETANPEPAEPPSSAPKPEPTALLLLPKRDGKLSEPVVLPARIGRGGRSTGLFLIPGSGDTEQVPITGSTIAAKAGGFYKATAQGRYWLKKPIPRGWVTVYVAGNPEPITDQSPQGMTALHFENQVGGLGANALKGGLKPATQISNLGKIVLGIGVAVGLFIGAVMWYKQRFP